MVMKGAAGSLSEETRVRFLCASTVRPLMRVANDPERPFSVNAGSPVSGTGKQTSRRT